MTATPLSARVRALEAIAEMLPILTARRDELEQQIAQATSAARKLEVLSGHIGEELTPPADSTSPGVTSEAALRVRDTPRLSPEQRVLSLVAAHPGLSAHEMIAMLQMPDSTTRGALKRLRARHELADVPSPEPRDQGGVAARLYYLPGDVPVDPSVTRMPTLPDDLAHDERNVYDYLRHAPSGLTARVLAARLNWKQGRVNHALAGLLHESRIYDEQGRWFVQVAEQVAS